MLSQGVVLALLAGSMAALASVAAKLATSYDESLRISQVLWKISTFKYLLDIVLGSTDDDLTNKVSSLVDYAH